MRCHNFVGFFCLGTLRVTGVNPYHAGTCGAVQLTVVGDGETLK